MELLRFPVGTQSPLKVHGVPALRCNMSLSATKTISTEMFKQGKVGWEKDEGNVPFPKVFFPSGEKQFSSLETTVKVLKENKDYFEDELKNHGALFFRGFPIHLAEDFNEFIAAFGFNEMIFQGRAPRNHVVGRVWTANEGSLDNEIVFHHEMSWAQKYPSKIIFFCEVAAKERGETSIVQSHKVAKRMEKMFPEFYRDLKLKGLIHKHRLHSGGIQGYVVGKSWQEYFGTEDQSEAQRKVQMVSTLTKNPEVLDSSIHRAEERGLNVEWKEGGVCEIIRDTVPGIREYQGKDMWFNQIPLAMSDSAKATTGLALGDNTEIGDEVGIECKRIMDEECVDVKWKNGDVLLVNNLSVLHARRPGVAPRRVLVSLGE